MGIGVENLANEYIQNYRYQQSKTANQSSSVDFTNILSTKTVANTAKTEQSFEDMWKSRFPGAKYHVMDASKISQGVWERTDFPFEKFFQDEVDESILNWKPSGKQPAMADSQVQARLDSTLGKKSIIVPPELEEKMKNNSELAKSVMAKVENFIATHPTRPGRICSYLISLDENGEIAHFHVVGGGGNISQSSSEMVEAYYHRKEQHAKNEKVAEEKRLAHKERKEESEEEYIQKKLLNKAIEEYETHIFM